MCAIIEDASKALLKSILGIGALTITEVESVSGAFELGVDGIDVSAQASVRASCADISGSLYTAREDHTAHAAALVAKSRSLLKPYALDLALQLWIKDLDALSEDDLGFG
jgi:hypothetical protein